jgi:Carbohydrate esterase, sialic acid-specific acetylesterase
MSLRTFWLWACVLCVGVPALGAPVQVFILAGQSNMVGSGLTADLPTSPFDYQAPQFIRYSYDLSSESDVFASSGWELLRPSVRGDDFGPEITFGQRVNAALGEIAIIKQAANGTSLEADWDPNATQGPLLYQRMIDRVNSSLALLDNQGIAYELAGVLWMQGESDASLSMAPLYEQNLTQFISAVRNDLGAPGLAFTIGRISNRSTFSGLDIIRQAQANVAKADPNVLAVDLDHLTLQNDRVHFTSAGQIGLGEAFADAVLFGAPPEDFDSDGLVSDNDLNVTVSNWNRAVPAGAQAFGDVDGDGFVGQTDLKRIVDRIVPPPPPIGTGDLTGDGFVGLEDLSLLLTRWNQNVTPGDLSLGDTTGDGFVGLDDLTRVLSQWNSSPVDSRPPPPTLVDMDLDASGGVGTGDVDVLLASWSFTSEADPDLPVGVSTNPPTGDFNLDGVVDAEDLRFLLETLPASVKLGPEDLNADGFIGLDDLVLVLSNFNQSVSPGDPLSGDVTGDGFIGLNDLNAVLSLWNTGSAPPPGTSVPEPASGAVLVALGLGGFQARRRRG